MLGNEQGKVGVGGFKRVVLVAVSVHRNDTVSVFVYDDTVRIHTERSYVILEFFRSVNDFAFIKFVGKVRKNFRGDFHSDADIYAVGFRRNIKVFAQRLNPVAAASADGNNTFFL